MKLIDLLCLELSRLPGVGKRSAQRMAFHLLEQDGADRLIKVIQEAKARIKPCESCHNLTEETICGICSNPRRQNGQLCVVERVQDLLAMESSQTFSGQYFVLGGVLSPARGLGIAQLPFEKLWSTISDKSIHEVILALNSGFDSEATELYIRGHLQNNFPTITVSFLAKGLPAGGELEFLDRETIAKALEYRRGL